MKLGYELIPEAFNKIKEKLASEGYQFEDEKLNSLIIKISHNITMVTLVSWKRLGIDPIEQLVTAIIKESQSTES